MADQSTPQISVESQRPIEFRSTSEEVAVGAFMGSLLAAMATLVLGGFVGAIGESIGRASGGWSILGGSILVWSAFWLLPLLILMPVKPWWRFLTLLVGGAAYLAVLQWHIHRRDLGTFYPWILSALPYGIVFGTFYEPIRLARGGSTEGYADHGVTIAGGFVTYGNRNAMFLAVGAVLAAVADLVSCGRPRISATVSGLLAGGLTALLASSLLAWRGDAMVAGLFFGSVWNIAWACTALGALTGALSGWLAASIRERQEQHRRLCLQIPGAIMESRPYDKIEVRR